MLRTQNREFQTTVERIRLPMVSAISYDSALKHKIPCYNQAHHSEKISEIAE